jgi:hypothetical protein
MRRSIGITTSEPRPGGGDAIFTLSGFLSASVSDSSCFCCGSPTDLMLGGGGLLCLRCLTCGAEIEVEETVCDRGSEPVLQAA